MKSLRSRRHRAVIAALREARIDAGLTQKQLAKRIKRPQSFVSMVETGDRRLEITEFWELADALGEAPSVLVGRFSK